MAKLVDIASEFSRFPAGRFLTDGPASGEAFRETVLVPSLRSGDLTIVLDGVQGLPASFLEEAFGGLVRLGFTPDQLRGRMNLVARTMRMQRYPDLIWDYINKAALN